MIYGNDNDDDADDDSEKNGTATMIHEFMQNVRNFFLPLFIFKSAHELARRVPH